MSLLDDNDPIVQLSNKILACVADARQWDELTMLAALASSFGTALSYSTQKNGWEPEEIAELQDILHEFFQQVLITRAIRTPTQMRES